MARVRTRNPDRGELERAQRADERAVLEAGERATKAALRGGGGVQAALAAGEAAAEATRLLQEPPEVRLRRFTRETHDVRRCGNPLCPARGRILHPRDSSAAQGIRQATEARLGPGGAVPDYMRRRRFDTDARPPPAPPPFLLHEE